MNLRSRTGHLILPVLLLYPSLAAATTKDWTVMVYLNAKNSLEPYGLVNFKQMAQVGSSPDVNLIVEFGRPKAHYTTTVPNPANPVVYDPNPWTSTLRFYVAKNTPALPNAAVQNLGPNVDMGVGTTLADFVKWGMDNYPARHYMLIVWNHGQGWRFQLTENVDLRFKAMNFVMTPTVRPTRGNNTVEPSVTSERRIADFLELSPAAVDTIPLVGGFRSVSQDDDSAHTLYNGDIEHSLGALLGGKKLDILGFDACLMAMVETGYAFRNVANVMVGSEELVPQEGWQYADWLTRLQMQPKVDASGLGTTLIDSYKNAYGGYKSQTTLSAANLDNMSSIETATSALAQELVRLINNNKINSIKKVRMACQDYGGKNTIDLQCFLRGIIEAKIDTNLTARANDATRAIKMSVFANYASTDRSIPSYGSNGLAIYFPASNVDFLADRDHGGYIPNAPVMYPVDFVNTPRPGWAAFIQSYVAHVQTR